MKSKASDIHKSTHAHEAQRVPTSMVVPKGSGLPETQPADRAALRIEKLDPTQFAYHLITPRAHSDAERRRLLEVYGCWRKVWEQALKELDNADAIFSDDFTRQDELGSLFYADQCVGLTAYRWVDLSLTLNQDDSYFKVWPKAVKDQAIADGSRICVGSNLTVLPTWRGVVDGYSVKEILMTLAVKRFMASDADAMVGTMRNNRGMNGLVYRLGARPALQNVSHHGVQVDLITFSRRSLGAIRPDPLVDVVVNKLWQNTLLREVL